MLYVSQLAYGLLIMHLFLIGATLNDRQYDRLIFFNIVTLQFVFPILLPFRIFHIPQFTLRSAVFRMQHSAFYMFAIFRIPHFTGVLL